jgi:hypothetical protein
MKKLLALEIGSSKFCILYFGFTMDVSREGAGVSASAYITLSTIEFPEDELLINLLSMKETKILLRFSDEDKSYKKR